MNAFTRGFNFLNALLPRTSIEMRERFTTVKRIVTRERPTTRERPATWERPAMFWELNANALREPNADAMTTKRQHNGNQI